MQYCRNPGKFGAQEVGSAVMVYRSFRAASQSANSRFVAGEHPCESASAGFLRCACWYAGRISKSIPLKAPETYHLGRTCSRDCCRANDRPSSKLRENRRGSYCGSHRLGGGKYLG